MIFINTQTIMKSASEYEEEMIRIRRKIHSCPETGFQLNSTLNTVTEELKKLGYNPKICGKSGIIAETPRKQGKTVLLRADMDALPIREKTNLEYASENGNMHACGHDMHTAMLLGAAKILKEHEKHINGNVRLMFQPAEEILEGARDMIDNGVLENVDSAVMIHVMSGLNIPSGTVIVSAPGITAPSADYFKIEVSGKGSHSSMSHMGADATLSAAHILTALQEINARELPLSEKAQLTIGTLHSGTSVNSISDYGELNGIMRCFSNETRDFLKKRIEEISSHTAGAFRTEASVTFGSGCPPLTNDKTLSENSVKFMTELLGEKKVISQKDNENSFSGASGSEDFSYVSQKIPSIMLALSAGNARDGYIHSQHHPEVVFDEKALITGSAVYAYSAMQILNFG